MKNKHHHPNHTIKNTGSKKAITTKKEVAENPDERIDEDFPRTENNSAGSVNAFGTTENEEVLRNELNKNKNQDKKENNY